MTVIVLQTVQLQLSAHADSSIPSTSSQPEWKEMRCYTFQTFAVCYMCLHMHIEAKYSRFSHVQVISIRGTTVGQYLNINVGVLHHLSMINIDNHTALSLIYIDII